MKPSIKITVTTPLVLIAFVLGCLAFAQMAVAVSPATDGSLNTGVGGATLFVNTGSENTATGAAALFSNTTGFLNTANGVATLVSNTTGGNNTAIGVSALAA